MKAHASALNSSLLLSLLMALLYSLLVAGLLALHPGPVASAEAEPGPNATRLQANASSVSGLSAPGSLRLRMTLPYVPHAGPRPAEEI